jgi:hypothetical protein
MKPSALPDVGRDDMLIHRNRSRTFVKSLAEKLKEYFTGDESVRALSRHNLFIGNRHTVLAPIGVLVELCKHVDVKENHFISRFLKRV